MLGWGSIFASEGAVRFLLIMSLILLLACLITSLILFFTGDHWVRRVLFFPEASTGRYKAEIRYLPVLASEIDNMRLLVADILLGPTQFENSPLFPSDTRLVTALLQNDVLYLGLSAQAYSHDEDIVPQSRLSLQALANSVLFNFPWLQKIYFFIDGKAVSDYAVHTQTQHILELEERLLPFLTDLNKTFAFLESYPVLQSFPLVKEVFLLADGARWDERLFSAQQGFFRR